MSILLALLVGSAVSVAQYVPPEVSGALVDPAVAYGSGECPCMNKSSCAILTADRFDDGKELFVFHVAGYAENFEQWRRFDWSRLTSIAVRRPLPL